MASEWYYSNNGQPSPAPVSTAQLKQMAAAGQLLPTDMVWQEGMPNWVPAGSIKGLFGSPRSSAEQPVFSEPASSVAGATAPGTKSRGKKRDRHQDDEPASDFEPTGSLLNLHPALIFFLSVCTLGVFGLIYAFLVCNAYSTQLPVRSTDGAGRPLGRVRHPIALILFSILTLGFYYYYWAYQLMKETAAYTGRKGLNPAIETSLMLVFPPYAVFFSVFRAPELIKAAALQAGQPEPSGGIPAALFLIPCLYPALPILCMAQQDTLNQVWLQAP